MESSFKKTYLDVSRLFLDVVSLKNVIKAKNLFVVLGGGIGEDVTYIVFKLKWSLFHLLRITQVFHEDFFLFQDYLSILPSYSFSF